MDNNNNAVLLQISDWKPRISAPRYGYWYCDPTAAIFLPERIWAG